MRFVKARTDRGLRVGVLDLDGVVSLSDDVDHLEGHLGDDGESLRALGESILANPASTKALNELSLAAPVTPSSMRDFMIFEEHIKPLWKSRGMSHGPQVWYDRPIGYFSNVATLHGPSDPVEIPGGSTHLDFELEVGAIVGREAKSVTPDQAASFIAGYVILCDWSARDLQMAEIEGLIGPFKGKDFASSLGPIFVTPDELADKREGTGYDLKMTSAVNGREYGHDVWSSASWSFSELLSYASWNSRVESGALIGSGTCQGGCISELSLRHGAERYPWLAPGDEVTLGIERLGELSTIVARPARGAWPGYRGRNELPRI